MSSRIAVIGPVHPFKGGVAQHTAALALRLAAEGHEVEVFTWSRQYPKVLYPGQLTIDEPEFDLPMPVHRELAWNSPASWRRVASSLERFDRVVIAQVSSIQAPAYSTILRRLRRLDVRTSLVCHNVRPHEARFFDLPLLRRLYARADMLLVHSAAQAAVARTLTDSEIAVATMPPFMPASFARRSPRPGVHRRLLFFGIVRDYKGLDVLLRALALSTTRVELRVVGEFWGDVDVYRELAESLGIAEHVDFRDGYVPAVEVPQVFEDVDALILPYRQGTASQNTWIGFEFGVPVVATRAGTLADDVVDGVNGLVVEAENVQALSDAIDRLYENDTAELMRAAVGPVDPEPHWRRYIDTLLGDQAR